MGQEEKEQAAPEKDSGAGSHPESGQEHPRTEADAKKADQQTEVKKWSPEWFRSWYPAAQVVGALATVVIAAVGVVQLIVYSGQWLVMRDSLELTRQSSELTRRALEADNRAWIVLSGIDQPVKIEPGVEVPIDIKLDNVGHLPARSLEAWSAWGVLPSTTTPQGSELENCGNQA